MRILLIEDEEPLGSVIRQGLEADHSTVDWARDGTAGLELARQGGYDVILLDLMLPGRDGWSICEALRRRRDTTPILMLTARGALEDRIRGFEIGADDYLPKPFNPRELVARINAILRRMARRDSAGAAQAQQESAQPERIEVGDVAVETGTRHVRRAGETVELTNVEYEILVMLLLAAGRVVTREELVRSVLGRELSVFDRSIDMHISHIRKKLGHHVGDVERIKTVRGVGYIYARQAEAGMAEGA
jgi:two-component system response regulator CpxR